MTTFLVDMISVEHPSPHSPLQNSIIKIDFKKEFGRILK